MKAVMSLLTLFYSKKLIVKFTSNKTRIPKKSFEFGGIPYRYISYENIIKPKKQIRQLGETTKTSKAGSNKRNMVTGTNKK